MRRLSGNASGATVAARLTRNKTVSWKPTTGRGERAIRPDHSEDPDGLDGVPTAFEGHPMATTWTASRLSCNVMLGTTFMVKSIHDEAPSSRSSEALEELWTISLLLVDLMAAGLADRGLSLARAGLIWELQRGGPVTQRALSQALRVTPRNVTGLVDALEADGLVERKPHPDDRRATLVRLSQTGEELAATLAQEQDGFAAYLFGELSAAELAAAKEVMKQLVNRVRAAVVAGGLAACTPASPGS